MKRILIALTLVATFACNQAGFAQTAAPAGDATATPASATPANDAAPPAPAPDTATAAAAPAPAATPAAANDAAPPAADASPAPAPAQVAANDAAQPPAAPAPDATTNAPAATVEATTAPAAPDAAKPAGAPQPGTLIPLIVMDDVPLTDAIRNLARQANINFMLDPKVAYGQVGADGKMAPQPSVTIRWENISAEQALSALLSNYGLQMTEDPKSKIARITIKDPAAPDPLVTKIIQLKYAPPTNVVASMQPIFTDKRSKVMPDVRTSQLVVIATEKEMVSVDELVASLDREPKQVLIEARILETTVNPKTTKGIDWSGTLAAQQVTMGNNGFSRAPGGKNVLEDPIENGTSPVPGGLLDAPTKLLMNASKGSFFNPSMAFLNADGVSAVISFLNTYTEVREISSPRTVTLDNERAVVEVGTLYPIVNTTAGTANTTGGAQVTYSNLTIRLEVIPRISANDYVNLTVIPSITKLGGPVTAKVGEFSSVVNSFLTRNLTTKVMVPSGNSLVMGGLIQDQINSGNAKVPLLGDIPILGYLFRQDTKDRSKTDLVLFVTPTIIQDQDYQPTKADFLKRPVPKSDYLEKDWSAWDSGQPKDRSKKKTGSQDPAFDEQLGQSAAPSGIPATATASTKAVPQDPAFDEQLGQSAAPSGVPAAAAASADR